MNKHSKTLLVAVVLVVYLVIMLKLFVFKDFSFSLFPIHYRYPTLWRVENNYIPLTTIVRYLLGNSTRNVAMRNLLGNIIPFLPIGILLPLIHRIVSWKIVLGVAIAFSLCIEILQLVLRAGIFDVDDLLLNTFGVMLGYAVFMLFAKRMRLALNTKSELI